MQIIWRNVSESKMRIRQDNKNAYGNFMQISIVAAICNKFQREIV